MTTQLERFGLKRNNRLRKLVGKFYRLFGFSLRRFDIKMNQLTGGMDSGIVKIKP